MNKLKFGLGLTIFLLGLVFVVIAATRYCVEREGERVFVLNADFEAVRKALVRGDFSGYMSERHHTEVLSEEWDDFDLAFGQGLRWQIKGNRKLLIHVNSDRFDDTLPMEQNIRITPDRFLVITSLQESTGPLELYRLEIRVERSANVSQASLSLKLGYCTNVPRTYRPTVDAEIDKVIRETLDDTQDALVTFVNENKDTPSTINLK